MITIKFKQWMCKITKAQYANNRTALQLVDSKTGEPIATATVNIPDKHLEENEIFIKNYSENEGMLLALIKAGIVEVTGRSVQSGFVNIPIAKIIHPELL